MKSEKTEKWFLIVLIGMFFILLSCIAHTAIPQKINYQGYLTNSAGVPVTGTEQMVFRIYDVASGGSALWTETQMVTVNKGVYSVNLGEVTVLSLDFSVPYYLGVQVGTDPEMAPRIPLTSAGYAFRAKIADSGLPGLGAWQEKSINTAYLAATDGFVSARGWSINKVSLLLIGLTDGSNPPNTIRSMELTQNNLASSMTVSIMMPVRKGDYWEVDCPDCEGSKVYWIPFGN